MAGTNPTGSGAALQRLRALWTAKVIAPLQPGLQIAAKALTKNKLQTGLTMTGMAIGVGTVLTMIALGSGAQSAIQDQVKAAGMNLIMVTAGNYKAREERLPDDAIEFGTADPAPDGQPRLIKAFFHPEDDPFAAHDHPTARQRLGDAEAGLGAAATLTITDADEIRAMKEVQYVSEGVHENAHISYEGRRWFTRMHGEDTAMARIKRAWVYPSGRFFTAREQRGAEQVVVLGSIVAEKLFDKADPVGRQVTLWNQSFRVVGVIGSSSWLTPAEAGDDEFDAIYLPVTTVHRLLNLTKLNDITVTTKSTGDVTRVSKAITTLLRERHKIGPTQPDDFQVTSQARKALSSGGMRNEVQRAVVGNVAGFEKVTLEQLGKTLDKASATMTALLVSIATVSLVVGGIGIMNVMLLSVTERTREIGIRRAVGARAADVLMQFLLEAVILSLAGGLLGVVIGCIAAGAISASMQWSFHISALSVAISFGVASMIGLFFGYYPARQASQIPPIAALRHE